MCCIFDIGEDLPHHGSEHKGFPLDDVSHQTGHSKRVITAGQATRMEAMVVQNIQIFDEPGAEILGVDDMATRESLFGRGYSVALAVSSGAANGFFYFQLCESPHLRSRFGWVPTQ